MRQFKKSGVKSNRLEGKREKVIQRENLEKKKREGDMWSCPISE